MNQLYKQSNNNFQPNTHPSKLSQLAQFNDPNRQKPNLLRINADNQDKKFMCIFWSIFLIFVITMAIASKTLPKAIKPITNDIQLAGTSLQGCQNPTVFQNDILACGNFSKSTPSISIVAKQLSSLNQFITFWLEIYPINISTPLVIDQNITYLLYGLQKQQNNFKKIDIYENQTVALQYTSQSTNYIYSDDGKTIKGYKLFIGFIGQFPANNLLLTLQFTGPFQQFANINTMKLYAFKIGKSFTVFTIVLRYVFFVLSILAAFLYNRKYRQIPITDRIIEQKLIQILSVFLIFFNDPFYPITVLKQNMARYILFIIKSSFFSMLFVISFIVYVIFMWVIFFDRILYEEGQKDTQQITKFKIAYAIVLFILLMILYMLYANYRLNNHPLVPTQRMTDNNILVLDALASVCFGAVILYIIFQYIRICCNKQDRLWRSELMMSYSLMFIVAMVIFVFTDNALGSYQYDGTTFIFLYGLMNLYVWYLQYMYSPTKETAEMNEKRSLEGDQLMSVGTVEFNDLNINLDQYDRGKGFGSGKEIGKKEMINQQFERWDKNMDKRKDSEQEKQQRNFSIEDDNQTDNNNHYQPNNKKVVPIQNHNIQHNQQIDFFPQQKITNQQNIPNSQHPTGNPQNNQITNSTNLLHLSQNQSSLSNHPQLSSQPSQEVNQNQLEILSQTVSQQPEFNQMRENYDHLEGQDESRVVKETKKDQGFGDFQLQ